MDALCTAQESVLERLERANVQGELGPRLNERRDPAYWLAEPGAPAPALENEKPLPQTVDYDELLESWRN
jgi:glycerol transport system substrate-binding protein